MKKTFCLKKNHKVMKTRQIKSLKQLELPRISALSKYSISGISKPSDSYQFNSSFINRLTQNCCNFSFIKLIENCSNEFFVASKHSKDPNRERDNS